MIEAATPTIRRRFRAPPIPVQGCGELMTFRIELWEGGATSIFLVAAYSTKQAAELLRVGVPYLKRYGKRGSVAECERAELTPGQVWVLEPGTPNYTKWRHQAGITWS